MYVPMPITDIALPLRHDMLYKNQSQVLQKCLTTTDIDDIFWLEHYRFKKTLKEESCLKALRVDLPNYRRTWTQRREERLKAGKKQ